MSIANDHELAHDSYAVFCSKKLNMLGLSDGDSNTKLFHVSIKKRQLQNTVFGFHSEVGVWVDETD